MGIPSQPSHALRESQGLKVAELSKAQKLAGQHRALIIQQWHEHID
jgi:hypothetical protein